MLYIFFFQIALIDHVSFELVGRDGEVEIGIGSGVTRDVYSSFWTEIMESLFVGVSERVPIVRHDLFIEEWEAIGKILVHGYKDNGYFPVVLSKSFVSYILFDQNSEKDLLNSFKNYLSPDERKLIDNVLENDDVLDSDEFSDLLEQFKCRTLVKRENCQNVLLELARQELIQKPHLMASCWRKSVSTLKQFPVFKTSASLEKFYEDLQPSSKKLIAMIEANPIDESEREFLGYLKRFIRGLDTNLQKKFLRYTTGSDVLITDKLSIMFVKQPYLGRRPIAHTCGPNLELSSTYSNFGELREEFSNILNQSTWEMDIL